MIYVLANDGQVPGIHVEEFDTVSEATDWINDQLVYVEGVGRRSSKMYRMIEGVELEIVFNLLGGNKQKADSL